MASQKLPEPQHRRRLTRWAALHAWKLAGLTAIVTVVGVFIAVTLSLILRPTRSYFFPLLSDVDKHQPEGAILRVAFVAATVLLVATTSASILHCHTLRIFAAPDAQHSSHLSDALMEQGRIASPLPSHVEQSSTTKRRVLRLSTLQLVIVVPMSTTIALTFLQYSGMLTVLMQLVHRTNIITATLYVLCVTWALAMCFLVWYFLKLQTIPDRTQAPRTPDSRRSSLPPDTSDASISDASAFATSNVPIMHRFRAWASWLILVLRPICLTGQVVCVIKIVGLWLALDTFSISNIRLVKIALLAALAFAEYTAAFFFAFFMTILAVDMRAKATVPEFFQLDSVLS